MDKQNELKKLREQVRYCKGMMKYCQQKGDFYLQLFYQNAMLSYKEKVIRCLIRGL